MHPCNLLSNQYDFNYLLIIYVCDFTQQAGSHAPINLYDNFLYFLFKR